MAEPRTEWTGTPVTSATPAAARPGLHGPSSTTPAVADEEIVRYVHSASDVLRLVVFGAVSLLMIALTRWAEDTVIGVEEDVVALLSFLSPTVERILAGLAQVAVVLIGVAVLVPAFVTRRYRLLGYILLANVATSILVSGTLWWLDRAQLPSVENEIAERAGVDTVVIDPIALAQIAASFIVLAPFVSRRWRQAGVVAISVLALLRLVLSAHLPSELFVSLSLGATAGCIVLLALGRPDQRPTFAGVRRALDSSGLPVTALERASVDARGSTPYFGTLDDGTRFFAKSLSPEERAADLMFRLYRFLRLKNVGDERPFSSLRRTVEHEALVSLFARDVDVRTPRIRAVADVGQDSMILAYELIDGTSLDRIPDEDITDDLLDQLWGQVELLHRHRLAHRDLRRANVLVDRDGRAWIIDFGFSELAASDRLLAADIAQLLVALALSVGPERAAASAFRVLGAESVGSALPMIQPAALSGATRTALKGHRALLDELRGTIEEQGGLPEPELEQLDRVKGKQIFTLATLALATYFLIPQLADVPGIVDQVSEANWAWFAAVLVMSAITYVGATLSFSGAVPDRLPLIPALLTQIGSSFASKLAPAGLGGMALNTRFAQKAGVDPAVAVSSVGLNSVAGLVAHMTLLLTFAVWAGRDAFGAIELPDPKVALYGLAATLAIAAVGFAIPAVRWQIGQRLVPVIRRSVNGLATTLRRPSKVALVLGGSVVVTLSYISAVWFSIQAFGGSDLSFAQVGAVYLMGAAVATAAPTPGGLGALEAAVIAGLVAAGMDNAVAVPSVFLYRIATFWIPILPGWLCFHHLERAEYI